MFQNITREQEFDEVNTKTKRQIDIRKLFSINDIVLYAISFMISMVSFGQDLMPFGLAIFAASCSNKIPVGPVYVAVAIGTFIKFGVSGLLTFLVISVLFILAILIFRPNIEEPDRNEKQKLGIYLFIVTFIVQAGKMIFSMFLVYDLLVSIMLAITTYIFYKIFSNSIVVIKQYGIKRAFSIEEVMGASLLLAIAFTSFNKLNIFGFSITNILSIMLVLFLGWKNGMVVGGTSGIVIGMVLGLIIFRSPVLVAAYAISGMIAGILNKVGKIGVIIGFCIGNVVLAYFVNGNTIPIITIREILIASLGLLAIPKSVHIDITEIIPNTRCLPTTVGRIEGETETIQKLNSMSETISDIAKSYNESATDTLQKNKVEEENKKSFISEFLNTIDDLTNNILYEDIIENDEAILGSMYELLQQKQEINNEDFIYCLEKNNNYIIGINSEDLELKKKIEKSISEFVKSINSTYKIHKLNIIWKQKEASNKKTLATQLGGVSKAISSIAEGIKEEKEEEKVEEQYSLTIGMSNTTKSKSNASGDSYIKTKLEDGKYMIAISDGMGSRGKSKKK